MKKLIEKHGKLKVILVGAIFVIVVGLMVRYGVDATVLNQ